MTDSRTQKQHVAATIRSALYTIEREASHAPISSKVRAFYHDLLTQLGRLEDQIERRKGDERS